MFGSLSGQVKIDVGLDINFQRFFEVFSTPNKNRRNIKFQTSNRRQNLDAERALKNETIFLHQRRKCPLGRLSIVQPSLLHNDDFIEVCNTIL